ncbi:hypothetical protein V7114_14980 [Neobacillus niacini]|uniref:hypothetical protein n=1 Tax=Neobacillus niacini TaxID=86668 RepID=UPI002FFF39EF
MGYTFISINPLHSFKGDCYVKFLHREYSVYTEFTYTDGKIYFKEAHLDPIAISTIQGVQVINAIKLVLFGNLHIDNQTVQKLEITIYPSSNVDNVLGLIQDRLEVQTGRIILTNGEDKQELPVRINKLANRIEVIDSKSNRKIIVLDQNDPIFQSGNVLLTFNKEGYPYYLIFDEMINFDLSDFSIRYGYYHSYCQLFGSMGSVRFKGQLVSIRTDEEGFIIIDNFNKMYSFCYERLKLCRRLSSGMVIYQFTTDDGEECYINFSKVPREFDKVIKDGHSENKNVVVINLEPVLLTINEKIIFFQSKDNQISFFSEEISSVEIIENQEGRDIVVRFHIPDLASHKIEFNCMESLTSYILGNIYKLKKQSMLKEATITDMYTSWSRQMNDFLIYNLFGQLVILKDGIKDIQQKEHISSSKKNEQILNFMYYAIIEQKRILDRVAIHFPELLMMEENRFMSIEDGLFYEKMQKQLFVISNQVQRHLSEIESSLNAVSFSIIPRKNFEKHVKAKSYIGAGLLGALGIITGGIVPIIGGGVMAIRTYYANKESNDRQVITEENEQSRIYFFVNKALDAFEHMMETMIPYYMNQASKTYYFVSKKHSEMLPINLEDKAEVSKRAIFERLADLYVEKQLPLQSGSLVNKEMIIEQLWVPKKTQEGVVLGTSIE